MGDDNLDMTDKSVMLNEYDDDGGGGVEMIRMNDEMANDSLRCLTSSTERNTGGKFKKSKDFSVHIWLKNHSHSKIGKNVVTSKQVYPSAKARVKRVTLNNPDQTIIMPRLEGGEMDQLVDLESLDNREAARTLSG